VNLLTDAMDGAYRGGASGRKMRHGPKGGRTMEGEGEEESCFRR